jgi:CRISPR/Cas system-associated endonuclease Cas3-HD
VYISLCSLYLLTIVNYALLGQIDAGTTRDVQILILLTNVVIFLTMAVRGGLDYFGKRKAHEERKELMRLSQETRDKLEENTTITKETTRNVRHDVRGEINAMSMVQQLNARELAMKVEAENAELRRRMDELLKMFVEQEARKASAAPTQVEVINSPEHPVPVHADAPVFPQQQVGQQ